MSDRCRLCGSEHTRWLAARPDLRLALCRECRFVSGWPATAWLGPRQGGVRRFDPARSARWRDGINSSGVLRWTKDGLNVALALAGLGDSLLVWARRS